MSSEYYETPHHFPDLSDSIKDTNIFTNTPITWLVQSHNPLSCHQLFKFESKFYLQIWHFVITNVSQLMISQFHIYLCERLNIIHNILQSLH